MRPVDLAEKIETGGKFAGPALEVSAKGAFLLNLLGLLEIKLDGFKDTEPAEGYRMALEHVRGLTDSIPFKTIRKAHLALLFPWSRALISSCLGYSKVTTLGVPREYLIA